MPPITRQPVVPLHEKISNLMAPSATANTSTAPVATPEQSSLSDRIHGLLAKTGSVAKGFAQGVAKEALGTAASYTLDPYYLATEGQPTPAVQVPGVGEVKTVGRKAIDYSKTMGEAGGGLMALSEGILGSASLLSLSQLVTAGMKAIPKPSIFRGEYGETAAQATGNFEKAIPTIQSHLTSARQVLAETSDASLKANGGLSAVIDRAKTNLVDGLKGEGMSDVAAEVAKVNTAGLTSIDQFADAVNTSLQTIAKDNAGNIGGNFFSFNKDIAQRYGDHIIKGALPSGTLDARAGISPSLENAVQANVDKLMQAGVNVTDDLAWKPAWDKGIRAILLNDHMTGETNVLVNPAFRDEVVQEITSKIPTVVKALVGTGGVVGATGALGAKAEASDGSGTGQESFTDKIYNLLAGQRIYNKPGEAQSVPKPKQAVDVPQEWQPALHDASTRYPELPAGLIPAVLMMESSMGRDSRTKSLSVGEHGWIGGLDKGGRFDETLANMKKLPGANYRIRGVPGIDGLATPYAAIQAVGSVLTQLQNENPGMSLPELYFKKYVTNKKSDTPARRNLFNDLVGYYGQI